jgi:hypothetical protein
MTWTKLSDDFPDDLARVGLSDAAFRTHVEGLCWTMRRETGGVISKRDVDRFAESGLVDTGVAELLDAGLWQRTDTGYMVVHHMEHQPEREVLIARRANDAERQRRKRRKAARLADPPVSRRDDPRDDPRDHPRDPGRDGTGSHLYYGTTLRRRSAYQRPEQRGSVGLMIGRGGIATVDALGSEDPLASPAHTHARRVPGRARWRPAGHDASVTRVDGFPFFSGVRKKGLAWGSSRLRRRHVAEPPPVRARRLAQWKVSVRIEACGSPVVSVDFAVSDTA